MNTIQTKNNEVMNALNLIAGDRFEFCLTLYGAVLGRLPDADAMHHFQNLPEEVDVRIAEVERILKSKEFQSNPKECTLDLDAEVPDLYDSSLRLSNFMTHVMPLLHNLIVRQEDLIAIKSNEIGDLIREVLIDTSSDHTALGGGNIGRSSVGSEHVEALGREIEALKNYVQWELPKRIIRQVNHTIMINNAELDRQIQGSK